MKLKRGNDTFTRLLRFSLAFLYISWVRILRTVHLSTFSVKMGSSCYEFPRLSFPGHFVVQMLNPRDNFTPSVLIRYCNHAFLLQDSWTFFFNFINPLKYAKYLRNNKQSKCGHFTNPKKKKNARTEILGCKKRTRPGSLGRTVAPAYRRLSNRM
jgi:hypothetical protein